MSKRLFDYEIEDAYKQQVMEQCKAKEYWIKRHDEARLLAVLFVCLWLVSVAVIVGLVIAWPSTTQPAQHVETSK